MLWLASRDGDAKTGFGQDHFHRTEPESCAAHEAHVGITCSYQTQGRCGAGQSIHTYMCCDPITPIYSNTRTHTNQSTVTHHHTHTVECVHDVWRIFSVCTHHRSADTHLQNCLHSPPKSPTLLSPLSSLPSQHTHSSHYPPSTPTSSLSSQHTHTPRSPPLPAHPHCCATLTVSTATMEPLRVAM